MKTAAKKFFRLPYFPIITAPFILFAPVLYTGQVMYWGTMMLQFVPWQMQVVHSLAAGELPLWNPYVGMGAPLLANFQTAVFYPPTWLLYILGGAAGATGIAWGYGLLLAAHLAWGGVGMAKLTKKLGWNPLAQTTAGLTFGMSGYLIGRGLFPIMPMSAAWLPWILLACRELAVGELAVGEKDKKAVLKLSLFISLQLLAGHAQIAWYTLILAGVWLAYWAWENGKWEQLKNAFGKFILAGVTAGALTAIQILPTAEYLTQSQRASAVDFEFAMNYSYWPWRILTLFVPNMFGSPVNGDYWGYATYWEDHLYLGVLGIILVLAALLRRAKLPENKRLARFAGIILLVSFIFALGKNTPVFPWLYKNIPTFDMFQAPARYTLWAAFGFALLAGMGAHHWRRPEGRALYWSRLGTMGAFAVAVGAGFGAWMFANGTEFITDMDPTFIPALAWTSLWGVGVGILNLLAPPKEESKPNPRWVWAVVILLAVDLLVSNWGLNPAGPTDLYKGQITNIEGRLHIPPSIEQDLKFEQLLSFETFEIEPNPSELRRLALPNINILDQIEVTSNFDPLLPERYVKWMEAFGEDSPEMWERAGATWLLGKNRFVELENEAERVRWVACVEAVENGDEALEKLKNDPDPDTVFIEGKINEGCRSSEETEILWTEYRNNQVTVKAKANEPGYLVLADTWYPGWVATVDGKETPSYHADYLFRAVEVPAGEHEITFTYRPTSFYLGAGVSVLAWLGFAYVWRRGNA